MSALAARASRPNPTAMAMPERGTIARFADALRMEWTKLRSVRSTYWTLLALVGTIIFLGLVVSATTVSRWASLPPEARAGFDPTFRSLAGIFFGQLAVGVLGALVITSEYSTGMIRSTLAAFPQRPSVLAAKAATFGGVSLVVGTVACVAAFLAGQAVFASKGIGVSLWAGGELRAVLGGGVFLALLGLSALGLGAILRSTAGAISAFAGTVLVAPVVVGFLPSPWSNHLAKFLPSNAGQSILTVHTSASQLSPLAGFLVLAAWTAVSLGLAGWLIVRRDA